MKRIRIGNDILIRWTLIHAKGGNYDIEGKSTSLYLCNLYGKIPVKDYSVSGNTITWTFFGKDQRHCGSYSLVLCVNEGDADMVTTDVCGAFELVQYSCSSGGTDVSGITTESVSIESSVILGGISPAEFERLQTEIDDLKKLNLGGLVDQIVVITPEYGGSGNLDVKAFLYIIESHNLIENVPRPCFFKRERTDSVSFGTCVFNRSKDGRYLRLDIITSNSIGPLDMSKDEVLWSPDYSGGCNFAYLYDCIGGYLMTLGAGEYNSNKVKQLEGDVERLENRLAEFERLLEI